MRFWNREYPLDSYYGPKMKYFTGNGRVGIGSVDTGAILNFLIGPYYTSPNFAEDIRFRFIVDGVSIEWNPAMKRVVGTGIFAGEEETAGIRIAAMDTAFPDNDCCMRGFEAMNMKGHAITVEAEMVVKPCVKASLQATSICLQTSEQDQFFCWTNCGKYDWMSRKAFLYLTDGYRVREDQDGLVVSAVRELATGESWDFAAVFDFTENAERASIEDCRKAVKKAQDFWREWLLKLHIPAMPERACRIMEANLINIKMCQSYDGGFMACPHVYCFSYFRDSFGACQGLYRVGAAEEIRRFLLWANKRYKECGGNFNSSAMGKTIFQNLDSSQENLASESPAYFCIIASYYYCLTGDEAFIRELLPSLKIAVESQIGYLKKNGNQLRFNGDETERYVPRNDGDMYCFNPDFDNNYFSVSSLLLFLAALDFYVQFEPLADYETLRADVCRSIILNYADSRGLLKWQNSNPELTYYMTNYNMYPIWLDIAVEEEMDKSNVLEMLSFIRPDTGYLPISPGTTEGFTGHTMGILLSCLVKLKHSQAEAVLDSLLELTDSYGTFSEFYGPGGVSNSHNMNIFSSGIDIAAIAEYYFAQEENNDYI